MRAFWIGCATALVIGALTGEVAARDLTAAERAVVEMDIKKQLKDPDSARFKWLPYIEQPNGHYCGLVNAKNSYGGYTGDQPFYVMLVMPEGPIFAANVVGVGGNEFRQRAIIQQCAEQGYTNLLAAQPVEETDAPQ